MGLYQPEAEKMSGYRKQKREEYKRKIKKAYRKTKEGAKKGYKYTRKAYKKGKRFAKDVEVLYKGTYYCKKCKHRHKLKSKMGKKHTKYRK